MEAMWEEIKKRSGATLRSLPRRHSRTSSTPTLYPVSRRSLTQASLIEVLGEETSGEAEFVLLMENEKQIYVGVGSDHTDRKLEMFDIAWSKNICPNVISTELWSFENVLPHWDKSH